MSRRLIFKTIMMGHFIMALNCIIIEGARNSGKSSVIAALESQTIKGIKFRDFMSLLNSRKHQRLLSPTRQDFLLMFLEQCGQMRPIPIFDRMIVTDMVMAKVTHRASDLRTAILLEKRWARIALQIYLSASWLKRQN